jgi:siderophore synthetase component
VFTATPPAALADTYLPGDRAIFAIHPQVLAACPDDPYVRRTRSIGTAAAPLSVAPSSSTRTLLAVDAALPHALKIHFPFRISRYGRRMRQEVIEQAVAVSLELEDGIQAMDADFGFLREVIGICHVNADPGSPRGENWGHLVRDMRPFPHREDRLSLVPGFALYGRDFFEPASPLLLYELIGNTDPLTYVLDNIMLPIIRHWVGCFLNFGYLLEPHGQNVILNVAADRSVSRIIHRDLSVGIDMRRRRDMRLADDHLNDYNRMDHNAFHSITYDRFMGHHFFDRIVDACLARYPGLRREDFVQPCRDAFARLFPDHRRYFPRSVWYFSEQRDRFNKPLYTDTGDLPVWRP